LVSVVVLVTDTADNAGASGGVRDRAIVVDGYGPWERLATLNNLITGAHESGGSPVVTGKHPG